MRIVTTVLLALLLAMSFACNSGTEETDNEDCTPTYEIVSPEAAIDVDIGTWRIVFNAALLGCGSDLGQLEDEDFRRLRDELSSPADWSLLQLPSDSRKPEFRSEVVSRINELLGNRIVSDVLFFDISILDHNVSETLPTSDDSLLSDRS